MKWKREELLNINDSAMKASITGLYLFIVVLAGGSSSTGTITGNLRGEWNFRCPDAGNGSDNGIIRIMNGSATLIFPATGYSFESVRTRSGRNSLTFTFRMNDQKAACAIRCSEGNTLSATLSTVSGSFPMILFRDSSWPHPSPAFHRL